MAMNSVLFYPSSATSLTGKILNATGAFSLSAGTPTNAIQMALPSTITIPNFMDVRSFTCTSDDTSIRNLIIGYSPDGGTTFIPVGVVPIPIGAGTISTPIASIDLLNNAFVLGLQKDNSGNRIIRIPTAGALMAGSLTQVTSGKGLYLRAEGDLF